MVTNLIVQIWMDIDPVEGESRWYDPLQGGKQTTAVRLCRGVRLNQVDLTHYWKLN